MAPFWHFLLALTVTLSLLHLLPLSSSSSSSTSDLFDAWRKHHGKTYSSEQEYKYRLRVFEDNLAFVTQHNNNNNNNNNIGNNSSYKLSLNAFADLTHHEFKTSRFGSSTSFATASAAAIRNADFFNRKPTVGEIDVVVRDVPSSVDWRKKGAVTHVKDQERCGACWAFAATGAMEGINKIVTGSLVSLSEQELIDCDTSSNNGCRGGLMDYAYQFVLDNHGIDTEQDYPYQAYQDFCNQGKLKRHVVTIDGYTDIPPNNNEKQLLQAVAARPVSVGISGSGRSFQFYSQGIFDGPCSDVLDHAVLIVGYGSENGVDYWIVKNSWGTRWGMDGYVYMIRNGYPHGACGINLMPSYPTKTSPNPPTPPSPSPPPAPGPNRCDIFTSCLEGETCCCTWSILGICFSWKCCELDSAVCCKDHLHCCPHDYPVCDTKKNQCLKHTDNVTAMEALEKRGSFSSFFEALIF